jgi:Fic family protein
VTFFRVLRDVCSIPVRHYQFEAIHPFSNGNGRTGGILNVLMLVDAGLLRLPVLYLSRYIVDTKSDYYRLLLAVTAEGWDWGSTRPLDLAGRAALSTL